MSEFLPKEIGGFAGIAVLTLSPPTSHASLPGRGGGWASSWELSCPGGTGKGAILSEKLMCLGHFPHVKLSWVRKLADHSLDTKTVKETRGSATYSCWQTLVARSALARLQKRKVICLGLQDKSRMKSQMEKEKVYPWTCHVY